jgi:hypothetical protein
MQLHVWWLGSTLPSIISGWSSSWGPKIEISSDAARVKKIGPKEESAGFLVAKLGDVRSENEQCERGWISVV